MLSDLFRIFDSRFFLQHFLLLAVMILSFFLVEKILLKDSPQKKRRKYLLQTLLFLNSFFIYYICLAPGITGDDSAEYALKVMNFGIAHGGGYPFYLALGKIFAIPFRADYVYALNLMSALFSAMSVVALSEIIHFLTKDNRLLFYIPFQFALIPAFWSQAVVAEVTNINTFTALVFINFLIQHRNINSPHRVFCFLTGLATGIYFPVLLVFPAIFLYLFIKGDQSLKARIKNSLNGLFSMFLGVSIVIAVTIILTRKDYPLGTTIPPIDIISLLHNWMGGNTSTTFSGISGVFSQIWIFSLHYFTSYLGITIILSICGVIVLFRRDKKLFILFVAVILVNGIYVYVTHVPNYHMMTNISYASTAVIAAIGYKHYMERYASINRFLIFFLIVAPMILFTSGILQINKQFPRNARVLDLSSMTYYEKFVQEIFRTLPPNAIIFAGWCEYTSIRYMQALEKRRSDIEAYEIGDNMWYNKQQINDWRKFVERHAAGRSIYITCVDSELLRTMKLVPIKNKLWQVVPQ